MGAAGFPISDKGLLRHVLQMCTSSSSTVYIIIIIVVTILSIIMHTNTSQT
jgi:hypothetical protein